MLKKTMNIIIPDQILEATRMTEKELMQEIAVMLYQKEKITLGQASQLAQMNQLQFQHLLASQEIPINYDIQDLEMDLKNLAELERA